MIGWMELSDKRMDNIQETLMLDRSLRMKPGGEKNAELRRLLLIVEIF